MKIYLTEDGVDEYIKMCEGYDNSEFKDKIAEYLKPESTMLEIGSGPGNDFKWLNKTYKVTGSDFSEEFLKRLKLKYPKDQFLNIDAISIDVDSKYDSILSSKVYQHFSISEVEKSLKRQFELLNDGGIIIHFIWIGGKEFDMEGMHFVYHTKDDLITTINKYYNVVEAIEYEEFEKGDSLLLIAKMRN